MQRVMNVIIKQHMITERMCLPTCKIANGFVGPCSHYMGNFSKKVLGEPSNVGVGMLLVGNCITSSSSYTVLYKGKLKDGG